MITETLSLIDIEERGLRNCLVQIKGQRKLILLDDFC